MMTVIDEVGSSDVDELEDGEIEEEEGQITSNIPDEFGSVLLSDADRDFLLESVTKPILKNEEKSKVDNKYGTLGVKSVKPSSNLPKSHSWSSLPQRYRDIRSKKSKSTRSKSPSPGRRERDKKRSGSSSSSTGKSRAQRRASEAVKRARRRDPDRDSPGRRKSQASRNSSRIRSRSRSPIFRYRRSYRPPTHEPNIAEYERLLRDHRSIQNQIKEEERRLSGGSSHGSKSSHGSEREQSKSWGKSKEKQTEKSVKKIPKQNDDYEDEEMMLLELRQVALASLAKEEKGKEKEDKETDSVVEDGEKEGKKSEEGIESKGDVEKEYLDASQPGMPSDSRENASIANEVNLTEAIGDQDTSVSEGHFDNYEEVEMEVDDEDEEKENVQKPGSLGSFENIVKSGSTASVMDLAKDDDDDDDENLLRAQLLKAMLTKRAAKAKSEKITSSTGSTPSKPLSPATPPLSSAPSPPPPSTQPPTASIQPTGTSTPPPNAYIQPTHASIPPFCTAAMPPDTTIPPPRTATPPPSTSNPPPRTATPPPSASNHPPRTATPPLHASTPPNRSRSSSPITTKFQHQTSVVGQIPSRAKHTQAPVHQPLVINLNDDSEESEDESSSATSIPFMGQLDSFLKEFRMSSNTQSDKTTTQTAIGKKQSHSASRAINLPKTPDAMKTAPTPHRQEYHRLREEIARREQNKNSKTHQAAVRSEKHEKKSHKNVDIGRREMQVRISGKNERQVLKGAGSSGADRISSTETGYDGASVETRTSHGPVNAAALATRETNPADNTLSLEDALSRELSAIRKGTSSLVTMETHPTLQIHVDAGSGKGKDEEQHLQIENQRKKEEEVMNRRVELRKRLTEELRKAEIEKQLEEDTTKKKDEIKQKKEDEIQKKNLEMERQKEELKKAEMEKQKKEEEIQQRRAEMQRKKKEEMERRKKQISEWERKRKEYSLLLKKDKGLIMNQEQQIVRRRKEITAGKVKLERLKEQLAAMEKQLSVNQAQILKHVKQKTALEERMAKHLELDNHARTHLAKLRGVAITEISQSEFLPSTAGVMTSMVGEKRRKDAVAESSKIDSKKAKVDIVTSGKTADLKKLQDMERQLADKIREFREAEARKALVGVATKSVIPESKAKLVRQLSASKPSAKIYTKDVIKLNADSTAPVDVQGVKVEGSNVKGQERRKSWLDANRTLTPNIKSRTKPSTPMTPTVAALGKMKAKFKSEGQRSGQRSNQKSVVDTSLESDLLQWIELSESTGSPTPDLVKTSKNLPLFSEKALKSGYLSRIKKSQKATEKHGPDFSSIGLNMMSASAVEPTGHFHVDWCKGTIKDQEGMEEVLSSEERLSPVHFDATGFLSYRSSLLPFKAFRLSPLFRDQAGYSVQSPSFTNKLDSSRPLCQYELKGTCNDDDCVWQHERDYIMSNREMLTDLLSYNAVKSQGKDGDGKNVPASPIRQKPASSDVEKLNACIEKVLGGNNEGVVSRLISCPRKWRPRPRPRSKRLSSGEDDALTEILPLYPPKYPQSSVSMTIRKDAASSLEEEVRYFSDRGSGSKVEVITMGKAKVHDLEAAVMEKPQDIGLWLRLARGLLEQETSVDRALNALSRGLELNCNSSALWVQYLSVYKERVDRADYMEMCHKATELAPCYSIWWMLLEAESSVLTKLEICKKVLQFLKHIPTSSNSTQSHLDQPGSCSSGEIDSAFHDANGRTKRGSVAFEKGEGDGSSKDVKRTKDVDMDRNTAQTSMTTDHEIANETMSENDGCSSQNEESQSELTKDAQQRDQMCGKSFDSVNNPGIREEVSHQVLEILLYQAQLQLNVGHKDDAVKNLKCALSIPIQGENEASLCSIMTTSDLFLGWLSLMHIHATSSLPSSLFDPAVSLPSRVVKKDLFSIPWKSDANDLDKQAVDDLWEGATRACTVGRAPSEQIDPNVLELYNIEIEVQLGSDEWVDQLCKLNMTQCRPSKEGEELYCRCIEALHERGMKPADVLMHMEMGVSQLPFSSRLHFLEAQLRKLYHLGDPMSPLRQCIRNFYQIPDGEEKPDEYLLQLYRHQLKLPLPVDFKLPTSSPDVPAYHRDECKPYMWLCYIMLTNSSLGERLTCEAFESALVLVQGRKDLELIWIKYLRFATQLTKKDVHESLPSLSKLVHRCLVSTATQYPIPFDTSGALWNDFSFHDRVIAVYLEHVCEVEKMEVYEKFQLQMPDNVILAYRSCQYAVENGFSQLGLQIAYSTLHRHPECIAFWKIVISLALQSQRIKEYISFVITHDDEMKLRNVLQRCQEIGLQQSDVLPESPIT